MNDTTPKAGHNNPPDALDEALAPFADYITEAESWLDGEPIQNEDQLKAADALLKQIKAAEKAAKEAEEAEAKPLHQAWQKAKARFKPTLTDLDRMKRGLAALSSDFKLELANKREAERRAAEAEARRLKDEAQRAAEQAVKGNIESERAAEAAAQEAKDAAAKRAEANKAKVTGLRTVKRHKVESHKLALNWILANDREVLVAFIDGYAARHHADKDIDGVSSWTEKVAY